MENSQKASRRTPRKFWDSELRTFLDLHFGQLKGCTGSHQLPVQCILSLPKLNPQALTLERCILRYSREKPASSRAHTFTSVDDAESFDFRDRQQIASSRRNEDFVGRFAGHPRSVSVRKCEFRLRGFHSAAVLALSRETPGIERRSINFVAKYGEDIGRSTLGHFFPFVEQHDFVEPRLLRFLIPVQVEGPGEHFCS